MRVVGPPQPLTFGWAGRGPHPPLPASSQRRRRRERPSVPPAPWRLIARQPTQPDPAIRVVDRQTGAPQGVRAAECGAESQSDATEKMERGRYLAGLETTGGAAAALRSRETLGTQVDDNLNGRLLPTPQLTQLNGRDGLDCGGTLARGNAAQRGGSAQRLHDVDRLKGEEEEITEAARVRGGLIERDGRVAARNAVAARRHPALAALVRIHTQTASVLTRTHPWRGGSHGRHPTLWIPPAVHARGRPRRHARHAVTSARHASAEHAVRGRERRSTSYRGERDRCGPTSWHA
eukprot:366229-Chlamydomonas_euryale.AAC.59